MKRRLIIVAGALTALLLLLAGYRAVHEAGDTRRRRPPPKPTGQYEDVGGGLGIGPGEVGRIADYDEYNRLRVELHYDRQEKIGGEYHLTRPRVEWHLRNGELVHISAREGRIAGEDVGGKPKIRKGELIGDVWIVLDRSTSPNRTPLEQRVADSLRIHVDEVRFDEELLTIDSDSYVAVLAKEADILGKGLRIAWSEAPRQERKGHVRRQLRELRIHQGEYMCIREGQEHFAGEALLPGGDQPEAEPTPPPVERGVPGRVGLAPPGGGAHPVALALMPAALAATATAPTSQPVATGSAQPPSEVSRMYEAVLTGDVRLRSGGWRIRGVDELTLVFELSSSSGREAESRPADEPGGLTLPGASVAPSPDEPADKPIDEAKPAKPLFVTWTGPLVLKPYRGQDQLPSEQERPRRFDVAGRGRQVELVDGDSRAVCESFQVHSRVRQAESDDQPGQNELASATGELVGSDASPVVLNLPDGERITVPRVEFDRDSKLANLSGPGAMYLPGGTDLAGGEEQPPTDDHGLKITWQERTAVSFGEQRIRTSDGWERRQYLCRANFVGQVDARQRLAQRLQTDQLEVEFHEPVATGTVVNRAAAMHAAGNVRFTDAKTGDFINSQKLDVHMTTDPTGRSVPDTAVATGSVSARQEKASITADSLTVNFTSRRTAQADRFRVSPTRLQAAGDVNFTDVDTGDFINSQKLDVQMTTDPAGKTVPATAVATGGISARQQEALISADSIKATFTSQYVNETDGYRVRPRMLDAFGTARRNVRLESVRKDQEGFLTQRVLLRSPKEVHYDVAAEVISCPVGMLSVEDYRPPDEDTTDSSDDDPAGDEILRPSQSAFSWTKSMEMDQKKREVKIAGDVRMAHRSGDKVVLADKLKVPAWPEELPKGRRATLSCDEMEARFAEPEPQPLPAKDDPTAGPRLGPLEMFDARRAVNFADGPYQVLCRRILYERETDVATIWGSLPGEPVKDAFLYYYDDDRRILNTWKSPKLIWHRGTNRIETKGVEVHGGR